MLTLFGVLVATAPFAVVFGLLAWTSRRERLRRDVQARQVALTDSMDMNEYVLEILARDRLAEMRAGESARIWSGPRGRHRALCGSRWVTRSSAWDIACRVSAGIRW